MHLEANEPIFVKESPHVREVRKHVDPAELQKQRNAKIQEIGKALATRSVSDDEAWELISDFLSSQYNEQFVVERPGEMQTEIPLANVVHDYLVARRAPHLVMVEAARTYSGGDLRTVLKNATRPIPQIHQNLDAVVARTIDLDMKRHQVAVLRNTQSLLVDSTAARTYEGRMAVPHTAVLRWRGPSIPTKSG